VELTAGLLVFDGLDLSSKENIQQEFGDGTQ